MPDWWVHFDYCSDGYFADVDGCGACWKFAHETLEKCNDFSNQFIHSSELYRFAVVSRRLRVLTDDPIPALATYSLYEPCCSNSSNAFFRSTPHW